ncbi:MAG: hypothetical protein H7210_01445 [Pyrinomonadaceae bacterium]|nr:hypothetical protein [Phycisphaerales bacterium]
MMPGSTNPPGTPNSRPPLDLSRGVSPELLDAFLDGLLSPEEMLTIGRVLENETASKSTMQLQQGIDRVLREQFCGGAMKLNLPVSVSESTAAPTPASRTESAPLKFPVAASASKRSPFMRALTAIAAMMVVSVGALWGAGIIDAGMLGFTPSGLVSPGTVYEKKVASGFQPEWKCTTDEEFREITEKAFAQSLLVASSPGIEVAGWAYYDAVLSADTHQLLVNAHGDPVMVFIDYKDKARTMSAPKGMYIHKRVLGNVVMYELTGSKKPQVLELFYDPTQGGPPEGCGGPEK